MNDTYMPTPEELHDAPELVVLAVLDFTLGAATRALIAAYPELCEDKLPRYRIKPVICGDRILSRAIKLQVALARYRQAVFHQDPLDSDATDDLDALSADAF